jgi:hypothetical protein
VTDGENFWPYCCRARIHCELGYFDGKIFEHEFIWLPPDDKIPVTDRHTLQSETLTLTIIWNPNGFHAINVLSKAFKFNTDHYSTHVLIPFAESCKTQAGKTDRKLIFNADSTCPRLQK